MEKLRKPFQGVGNIIRFNWHFYLFAFLFLVVLFVASSYLNETLRLYCYIISILVATSTFLSLSVSLYVYDLSGLYNLNWIENDNTENTIVTINAGFDETSHLLKDKFPHTELIVLDFYDPEEHTEVSIKRARKAYPSYPGTKEINTSHLPLEDNSVDKIFLILAAHEIRDEDERTTFFKELKRVLKPEGKMLVTEHLRDTANFLAYNIGFFHFHSKATWKKTFHSADLKIKKEIKLTPFISTFILEKNGTIL